MPKPPQQKPFVPHPSPARPARAQGRRSRQARRWRQARARAQPLPSLSPPCCRAQAVGDPRLLEASAPGPVRSPGLETKHPDDLGQRPEVMQGLEQPEQGAPSGEEAPGRSQARAGLWVQLQASDKRRRPAVSKEQDRALGPVLPSPASRGDHEGGAWSSHSAHPTLLALATAPEAMAPEGRAPGLEGAFFFLEAPAASRGVSRCPGTWDMSPGKCQQGQPLAPAAPDQGSGSGSSAPPAARVSLWETVGLWGLHLALALHPHRGGQPVSSRAVLGPGWTHLEQPLPPAPASHFLTPAPPAQGLSWRQHIPRELQLSG